MKKLKYRLNVLWVNHIELCEQLCDLGNRAASNGCLKEQLSELLQQQSLPLGTGKPSVKQPSARWRTGAGTA